MKCPELTLIEEYASGELAEEAGRELEAHLESCVSCRAILDRERRLNDLLRAQVLLKAPPQLRLRVMETLETESSDRAVPEWFWVLGMGVAVVLMGLILGRIGSPYLDGFKLWIGEHILRSSLWQNLTDTSWLAQLSTGSSMLVVNLGVAGIILCWGLWQMIKALRR